MFRIGRWVAFVIASHVLAVAAASPPADVSQQAAAQQAGETFDQEQALAQLRSAISGKEEKPAVEVFKNIKQYKGVSAGRLLRIMARQVVAVGETYDFEYEPTAPGELHLEAYRPRGVAATVTSMIVRVVR